MRISDWSSDVCSSDLTSPPRYGGWAGAPSRRSVSPADRPRGNAGAPGAAPRRRTAPTAPGRAGHCRSRCARSEEHTSELQSLMRISYAVFCLKKKKKYKDNKEVTTSQKKLEYT